MNTMKAVCLIIVIFMFFMVVFTLAEAKSFEKPPTPNTGVYVIEIDQDWVKLAIDPVNTFVKDVKALENLIHTRPEYGSEIVDTAAFACSIYNRNSVFLSAQFDTDGVGLNIFRMYWLFGCAIP